MKIQIAEKEAAAGKLIILGRNYADLAAHITDPSGKKIIKEKFLRDIRIINSPLIGYHYQNYAIYITLIFLRDKERF